MSEKLRASITYKGKTVDMDDKPAAAELVKGMLLDINPALKGGSMPEIVIQVKNIRNVEIKSKVVQEKNSSPKIVSAVHFEYDGEPSLLQSVLLLEAQSQRVNASFTTPQLELVMDEKKG